MTGGPVTPLVSVGRDARGRFVVWGPGHDGEPTNAAHWQVSDAIGHVARTLIDPDEEMGRPMDPWAQFPAPDLPEGLLPNVIEEFARVQGEMMGADPGGLAASALAVCAAALPDRIAVQVKRHDPHWLESARLWVALVGEPSTKKSPIIAAAARPLKHIDKCLHQEFAKARAEYDKLPADERRMTDPPSLVRARLEDVTPEAAQDVLRDSPEGVLCIQDELSGWFGSMDAYKSGKGAQKDRGFWLQAFNGGTYAVNRVGRGSTLIPNLSVSLLGGIQPDPMRKVARDAVDDGLIQRLIPVVLRPATIGDDAPMPDVATDYGHLVENLFHLRHAWQRGPLRFSERAHRVREACERRHHELVAGEVVSRKLAAHAGKLDGIFARLCVLFHAVEHAGRTIPGDIDEATAARVAAFMRDFLWPHAVAFHAGVLGLTNDNDAVADVAGYIIAHELDLVTVRDFARGSRGMRKLDRPEVRRIMETLEAMAWVQEVPAKRAGDPPRWRVNEAVHVKFAERAMAERERRERAMLAIRHYQAGDVDEADFLDSGDASAA